MRKLIILLLLPTIFIPGCIATLGELIDGEIRPSEIAELENVTIIVPLPAIDGKPEKSTPLILSIESTFFSPSGI
ncbi:hypothetical protein [Archaeoglobus sp.]